MKRWPWPLTRMPWIRVRGGVIGSDTSPAYMLRTEAPMACAMRMPRPSSPSVPTLKVPRASGGQCWRSMSSLKMNPPAVSTTPRRARSDTVSPKRCACTPTTRPSSSTHEAVDPGVGRDRRARLGGRRGQVLHEQPAGRALRLGQVPPRRRPGDLVEGVRVLAARVDEALGAVRRHGGLGAERRVEGDAPRHQPVEMAEALGAVARRSWPRRDRARRPPSCSGTCRRGCPRSRTRSESACPRRGTRCPRPARPPRPGHRCAR